MQSTSLYSTVIFDLDGTLIDSSTGILNCFGHILATAGLQPLLPFSDSLIGPPLRQTLVNLTGLRDNTMLDQLVEDFKACYDTEGYKASSVYDGVEALLRQLGRNSIHMAIATNKRRVPTLKIMKNLRWEGHFQIVGTLDTPYPAHADKAALIRSLLSDFGVSPGATLYVGDKWEDGEAAAVNGMYFCAAKWGYGEWKDAEIPADWLVAESAHELIKMISG